MHRYTKILLKSFEKASKSLKRDILELAHLQNSPNLRTFINNSQTRFEKNIASELGNITVSIHEKNGAFKNISFYDQASRDNRLVATVHGIDSTINLSHGIENIAFAVSLLEGGVRHTSAICMPYIDSTVYTETENEVFIMGADGFSRKLKINQSLNVIMPYIVCATDSIPTESKIANRETYFISTGSILCDAFRVLENKVDVAIYSNVSEDYVSAISHLVRAGGGMDGFKDGQYIFGKTSIVKAILSVS